MWRWRLGRVFGIELKVHASFVLIVVVGALQWASFGVAGAAFGALLTLLTFASVTLHELGHSVVAKAFGIPVTDITLYPIGGVAQLGGKPKKPLHELLIALAGPAVNVVIATVLGLVLVQRVGVETLLTTLESVRVEAPTGLTLVSLLAAYNVVLAVFNMLPALPMDGGRVLRAVLSWPLGAQRATTVAATLARVLAVGLFAVGVWSNPFLCLIAVFVFFGAGQEVREQTVSRLLEGVQAADAVNPYAPRFTPDTTVGVALVTLSATQWESFAVEHFGRLVGVVTRADLLRAAASEGASGYVAGVMQRAEPPTVSGSTTLPEVRALMQARGVPHVAVVSGGTFVGLITQFDVAMLADQLARTRFRRPRGPAGARSTFGAGT